MPQIKKRRRLPRQVAHNLFLIAFALFAGLAQAAPSCWNANKTVYNCDSNGGGGSLGASAPLIGNTLGSNPAALPTAPSPFGLEGVYSDRANPNGRPKLSVSTIKGFEGIGFGIGSWSEGTFIAPDFPQHFLSSAAYREFLAYQSNPPSVLGLRLGTTILLPQGPFPNGIRFSLGASGGLGRVRGNWSPQVGVLARIFGLGLGYAENYERLSRQLPSTRISTFAAGFHLGPLYFGYTYNTIRSSVNRTFANSYSMRLNLGKLIFHGAVKTQKDHRGAPDSWENAGLLWRMGTRIGAGYEYGLYRHSHSGVLHLYL